MKRIIQAIEFTVAAVIIVIVGIAVCGCCMTVYPIRLLLDWDIKREAKRKANAI
jgi:hypothetical protein